MKQTSPRWPLIVAIASIVMTLVFLSEQLHCGTGRDLKRPSYVPGEVLVKYKPYVSASQIKTRHAAKGTKTIKQLHSISVHQIKLPAGMTVGEALEQYRSDPDVEYAEPNYLRYAKSTIPNDASWGSLWGLHNTGQLVNGTYGTADDDIDAPEAWDIWTGSSSVVIAVIDTGIAYDHNDLSTNIWTNAGDPVDGFDNDLNGYVDDVRGWDFVDDDNDPIDPDSHGTHVSGTIGAIGNNSNGITGVCWTASIMPLRVLGAIGGGSVADEILAIDYARLNGAKIINASLGSTEYSLAEYNAINQARTAGVLFVAAAGNDGVDNDTGGDYPASYNLDNIIAVAATDQDDGLASFSNYGATTVDVAAPGTNIYSTIPARQTEWSDDFDDNDISNWTTGGTSAWGLSTDYALSGAYSLANSPVGNYQNNADSWIYSPAIDLTAEHGAMLEFSFTGRSEACEEGSEDCDKLYVQSSADGTTWTNHYIDYGADIGEFISGNFLSGWSPATIDLGAYDDEPQVYVRFRFTSNATNTYEGFYIDDVSVTTAAGQSDYDATHYDYYGGTSMATPHVAGLAGLIWSKNPGLTYMEVKERILLTSDPIPSVTGKTVTGGRINAFKVLNYDPLTAPSDVTAAASSSSTIDITWTDNSSNESGFRIERKTGSAGTYANIATVGADATSYTSTGLAGSTTYVFRVRAYNETTLSTYSSETSATTYAPGSGGGGGGSCFIATAAFGSPDDSSVLILRHFRDRFLTTHTAGRAIVRLYYDVSPPLAEVIAQHPHLRATAHLILLPAVGFAWVSLTCGLGWSVLIILALLMAVRRSVVIVETYARRQSSR